MKKLYLLMALLGLMCVNVNAQRVTDKLDRGLVAVPAKDGGYLVNWRKFGEEYYDTKYNLYRNGTKIASDLEVPNFVDKGGSSAATYQVEPIVRGVAKEKSASVKAWANNYIDVNVLPVVNRAGQTIENSVAGNSGGNDTTTPGYTLNDVSLADVDGDGVCELIVKRNNSQGNLRSASNKTDFNLYECYRIDGTRLWWIDLGPMLMAGADEQWDMIGYDWDEDGKAEMLMRGADNMIIHTATGKTINIGNMNAGFTSSDRAEYMGVGNEYLLYLNGETGEPYGWDGSENWTPMAYPLPQFESDETYGSSAVWGDLGHRMQKHYFAAPYLDGRHASIFLGRGCYTRHKACALDVNPTTHELTLRWRWNCYDSKSPWYGNGFHNFSIADVDMDGRDEIIYGSMILDDTGFGLATTGLGHGDAQHCGDLDPYRWGLEQFNCLEGSQGNSYWNATTGQLYYRKADGGDDGRALAGNFTDLYPGGQGRSVSSGVIGLSCDKVVNTNGDAMSGNYANLNMRIYWDGDLLDEIFNSKNGANRPGHIFKWGGAQIAAFDAISNNWTKCNPSAQGDILGDWREELVLRLADNSALRIYTTNYPTEHSIYTLWHDHQYRNAMAWQCIGYNQPPHPSYFLGNVENITIAPPPLMLNGRTEVENGSTIQSTDNHLLISGYEDKTIAVQEGASPYILTVNTPAWVQGSGDKQATASTPKSPARTTINYTTTLTGGAFNGATRLVKQGEGTLILPSVTEKHTGKTDIWNGTLQFDGTMESSPVWLNRHTILISNGGQFLGGIKADYNATIYPGGKDNVGSITTSTLNLGFGSRIVFDVKDGAIDQVSANELTIETKDWEYGPKYKAPIFYFNTSAEIPAGTYQLGSIAKINGNISDIQIEGVSGKRFALAIVEGKLNLIVEDFRAAGSVVWNGTAANHIWDLAITKNFLLNGESDFSVPGDDVLFTDDAPSTTTTIRGGVSPKTITFNNETKDYTIQGDSIIGGGSLSKNGSGNVTILTENNIGNTAINAGKITVKLLANKTGQAVGALGDASRTISIGDKATLSVTGLAITDQQLTLNGESTIEVANGASLTINKGVLGGSGTILKKTGAGTMSLGSSNNYGKLIINNGTVNASSLNYIDQLPANVEYGYGALWGANDENTSITNNTNFIVPEGCTGEFRSSFRGTYNGKLTGKGTFKPVSGGVRAYWNGDWSQFEGVVEPAASDATNRQNKKSYTPTFNFTNDKGLPKATLRLNSGFTFYNKGPQDKDKSYDVVIAKVEGTGTLAGTGTYYIGGTNEDIVATFASTAPIVKRGSGTMTVTRAGAISGRLTIQQGKLIFYGNETKQFFDGTLTLQDGASLEGSGLISSFTMEKGSTMTPITQSIIDFSETPGTLKTTAACRINEGAEFNMQIKSVDEYSKLEPKYFTMNGILKVTLLDSYVPKVGDSFTCWTASTFSGTPTYSLPMLPEGLYWDTRQVATKTGILSITDDASVGIGTLASDTWVTCEVYTLGGVHACSFETQRSQIRYEAKKQGLQSGTYIVKMQNGRNSVTETIIVR